MCTSSAAAEITLKSTGSILSQIMYGTEHDYDLKEQVHFIVTALL